MNGRIIIVICIVVCVGLGGLIAIISLNSKTTLNQIPSDIFIITDREDIRSFETFIVSLNKKIPNANITWDFGVGFPSYGPSSQFRYLTSHNYIITATIKLDEEKKIINKTVPVKNQDITVSGEVGLKKNLNPRDPLMVTWDIRPMQGISYPTLNTSIEITKAMGSFKIVFFEYIVDDEAKNIIFSEDYIWINENVNLKYQFLFDDLPHMISDYYYSYQIIINEGKWDKLMYNSTIKY